MRKPPLSLIALLLVLALYLALNPTVLLWVLGVPLALLGTIAVVGIALDIRRALRPWRQRTQ